MTDSSPPSTSGFTGLVAIDGPAGAGKSTVAQAVAERLGFVRVDTGALYRAVALIAQESGVSWHDEEALSTVLAQFPTLNVSFVLTDVGNRLWIGGVDRDDDLRTPAIAEGASIVSQHPVVRAGLLGEQRRLGATGGAVFEGRDIGTVVFPEAELKIFLTASADVRANRRLRDLKARGVQADLETLLAAIIERDTRDASRAIAPLKPAADAILVDSSEVGFEGVVDQIVSLAERSF